MLVLATATQNVHVLRHSGGAWSCAALPVSIDSASTLVMICGTGVLRPDSGPVHELRGAFRSAALLGCSTSWLGHGSGTGLASGSGRDEVTALVWKLTKTRLSLASAPLRGVSDSFRAGQLLGQQLMTPSLRAMLVLADGGKANGSQFLRGLHNVVGEQVHVMGGLSSGVPGNGHHWVLRSGVPSDGFVSAVGFYGSHLKITQQSVSGWTAVGPQRRITRSRDCTVFELDGRPAWELYRSYLGDQPTIALAKRLPLAVRIGEQTTLCTVRHVDETNGAITFAADVPDGATAHLVFGPRQEDHATTSAPGASIQLTCVGAARLQWAGGVPDLGHEDEVSVASARLVWALEGEFSRRSGGGTDMQGGSITTTLLHEEDQ